MGTTLFRPSAPAKVPRARPTHANIKSSSSSSSSRRFSSKNNSLPRLNANAVRQGPSERETRVEAKVAAAGEEPKMKHVPKERDLDDGLLPSSKDVLSRQRCQPLLPSTRVPFLPSSLRSPLGPARSGMGGEVVDPPAAAPCAKRATGANLLPPMPLQKSQLPWSIF